MDSIRIPYVEKGTPNKIDNMHKGDFKLMKKMRILNKQCNDQILYYKQFLLQYQIKDDIKTTSMFL